MIVYYINLEKAVERRESIERAFQLEELVRVDAIDGMVWASGVTNGHPAWKPEVRSKSVEQGILAESSQLPPTHAACNLSHRMAWDLFLKTEDDWCVVLEDDVEPTSPAAFLKTLGDSRIEGALEIPAGCGMFYLIDEDALPGRLSVLPSGQVARAQTLAAYALNRRTAQIFMEAIFPMVHLADFQLPICTFEDMQKWVPRFGLQDFASKQKVKACGLKTGGLVRHSIKAKESQLGHPAPA